jgi:DHA3 family macrolide efflux protein-like MFS transporter
MTLYILCGFLPTVILSPYAGVWADRYNRKRLIMLSDSSIAVSTLILALLFLAGFDSIWLLFAVSAIRALGTAIQTPTALAMIPQMVPKDQLTRINGIQGSIQAVNFLIAPVVSGALMTLAPIESIFFIDVVTAIIGVATLGLLVKVTPHQKAVDEAPKSSLEEIKLGFRYIRSNRYVMSFFLYLSAQMFFVGAPAFLTPLQVTRSFGSDLWRLTAVELVFAVGMILGGLIMAYWGGFANRVHTMIFAIMMIGLFVIALGVAPNFWTYLFFMIIIGIALPMFNTATNVLLQEKVEEHYLGRVFAVLTMINSSMMPLGMVVFGPVSDVVAIEKIMIVTGALVLMQSFIMIRHKSFIEAGKKPAAI